MSACPVIALVYGYKVAARIQLVCHCKTCWTGTDDCDFLSCADSRWLCFRIALLISVLDNAMFVFLTGNGIPPVSASTCCFA